MSLEQEVHAPVAVVTGGAQGIGRKVAEALAGEGYALVLADLKEPLETLAALEDAGAQVHAVVGDVTSEVYAAQLAEQVRHRFGRVDVLVNNAGVSLLTPAEETTAEEWRRVLEVNLTGPFLLSRTLGKLMLDAGGGSIVNVASIAGLHAVADRAAYNASKHGLIGLTRTLGRGVGRPRDPRQRSVPRLGQDRDGRRGPGLRRLHRLRHRRTGTHGAVRRPRGHRPGRRLPRRPRPQRLHQRYRDAGGRRLDRRRELELSTHAEALTATTEHKHCASLFPALPASVNRTRWGGRATLGNFRALSAVP
jgi:NADP-dependent 3-hydroxy acid dehydrogenase YdfG